MPGMVYIMNFKDIKKSIGELADKATKKTEELADLATTKLKIAKLTSDREGAFLKLGKLTYKKLTIADETKESEITEKISREVASISELSAEIGKLETEYESKKREAEAQKKAKKAKEREFGEEEINTSVLDSFSDVEQ